MNGDLSLSDSLGGLRIANPDDSTNPLSATSDGSAADRITGKQSASQKMASESYNIPHPVSAHTPKIDAQYAEPRRPTDGSISAQPSPRHTRLSAAFYEPSRPRPNSAVMSSNIGVTPTYASARQQSDRMPHQGDSSPYDQQFVRRPSQRRPSGASHQNSSATTPTSTAPSRDNRSSGPYGDGSYSAETGLPRSSEAWKDRGAATSVRKEVDANGNPVTKVVKKGVKDFNFGRTLGEGSYSTVLSAQDRQTSREYAVKVLDKRHIIKEKKVKYVSIEKDTLNRLTDHPGIVRLYYTFQDEQSLYFVLDLATGGELLGVLKRYGTFDCECTRFYAAQILDSIAYMHSRGVIHRDLKPENVLLDSNMHTKITDFGTAKILDPNPQESANQQAEQASDPDRTESQGRAVSFVGTAEYVSPELLTEKNACKASDLWALGCIIYQLLAGRPPFKAGNEYQTFQKIVALDYRFPEGFPPVARDLVSRLLVLDPKQRLTIAQMREHEFFRGIAWGKSLWKQKAPKLKPYVPPEPAPIKLNDSGAALPHPPESPNPPNGSKPPKRVYTELPPPSQLDIDWSSVLTRSNERIVKLGNLDLTVASGQHGGDGKSGDVQSEPSRKFARLFSGGASKKKQRLVIVTSTARLLVVAAGGDDKKIKLDLQLNAPGTSYKSFTDLRGLTSFYVETVSEAFAKAAWSI